MNPSIKIIEGNQWSDFFHSELVDSDGNPTDNYYQLLDDGIGLNRKIRRLKLFMEPTWKSKTDMIYFFYYVDGLIVGHVSYQYPNKTLRNEGNMIWFSAISIDPDYKNRGIASQLVSESFKWVKDQGLYIYCSEYEPEGNLYLKNVLRRQSNELSLRFIDREPFLWQPKYFEWGTERNGKEITYEEAYRE